jgi:hypothetical protein
LAAHLLPHAHMPGGFVLEKSKNSLPPCVFKSSLAYVPLATHSSGMVTGGAQLLGQRRDDAVSALILHVFPAESSDRGPSLAAASTWSLSVCSARLFLLHD